MSIGGLNVNAALIDLMEILDRIASALEDIAVALDRQTEEDQ